MGTPLQRQHSRAGTLIRPHLNAWKPLLVRAVLVRKLLLVRVVDYPSQRGITVTYAQQSSTSSAERAIVQSVHILRREFVIHDCNVGPITWENQEMGKHLTDAGLASTSH